MPVPEGLPLFRTYDHFCHKVGLAQEYQRAQRMKQECAEKVYQKKITFGGDFEDNHLSLGSVSNGAIPKNLFDPINMCGVHNAITFSLTSNSSVKLTAIPHLLPIYMNARFS